MQQKNSFLVTFLALAIGFSVLLWGMSVALKQAGMWNPDSPAAYKWKDKQGRVQCQIRLEDGGTLVPCKDVSKEVYNLFPLRWENPLK